MPWKGREKGNALDKADRLDKEGSNPLSPGFLPGRFCMAPSVWMAAGVVLALVFSGALRAAPPNEAALRNAETFYRAGDQHRMEGNYDLAKREFREAIRLNPAYAEPHNGLGWIYYYSDSPKVALREFKKATALNPTFARAYLGLGLTYQNVAKWKDSERALRMAIRVWHYTYLPAEGGNLAKASDDAQRDPDFQQALSELAEVLGRRGKSQESKLWSDSLAVLERTYHPPKP